MRTQYGDFRRNLSYLAFFSKTISRKQGIDSEVYPSFLSILKAKTARFPFDIYVAKLFGKQFLPKSFDRKSKNAAVLKIKNLPKP